MQIFQVLVVAALLSVVFADNQADFSQNKVQEVEQPGFDFPSQSLPVFKSVGKKTDLTYREFDSKHPVEELYRMHSGLLKVNESINVVLDIYGKSTNKIQTAFLSLSKKTTTVFASVHKLKLLSIKHLVTTKNNLQEDSSVTKQHQYQEQEEEQEQEQHYSEAPQKLSLRKSLAAKAKKVGSKTKKLTSRFKSKKQPKELQLPLPHSSPIQPPKPVSPSTHNMIIKSRELIFDVEHLDQQVKIFRKQYDEIRTELRNLKTMRMDDPRQLLNYKDSRIPVILETTDEFAFTYALRSKLQQGENIMKAKKIDLNWSEEMGAFSVMIKEIRTIPDAGHLNDEINDIHSYADKNFKKLEVLRENGVSVESKEVEELGQKIQKATGHYRNIEKNNKEALKPIHDYPIAYTLNNPGARLEMGKWKPIEIITVEEWAFVNTGLELTFASFAKLQDWEVKIGALSLLIRCIQTIDTLNLNHPINKEIMKKKSRGSIFLQKFVGWKNADQKILSTRVLQNVMEFEIVLAEYIQLVTKNKEIISKASQDSDKYILNQPLENWANLDAYEPLIAVTTEEARFATQGYELNFKFIYDLEDWTAKIGGLSLLVQFIKRIDRLGWDNSLNLYIISLRMNANEDIHWLTYAKNTGYITMYDPRVMERMNDIGATIEKYTQLLNHLDF